MDLKETKPRCLKWVSLWASKIIRLTFAVVAAKSLNCLTFLDTLHVYCIVAARFAKVSYENLTIIFR